MDFLGQVHFRSLFGIILFIILHYEAAGHHILCLLRGGESRFQFRSARATALTLGTQIPVSKVPTRRYKASGGVQCAGCRFIFIADFCAAFSELCREHTFLVVGRHSRLQIQRLYAATPVRLGEPAAAFDRHYGSFSLLNLPLLFMCQTCAASSGAFCYFKI